jgi:hypothetical protein
MCCHGCARQRLDGYGRPLRYKANGVGPLLNVFYSTPILRPASKSFYDTGTAAVELGLGRAACARPLVASIIKEYAVPNTISQAWYLGRAVHLARRSKTKLTEAIVSVVFLLKPGGAQACHADRTNAC